MATHLDLEEQEQLDQLKAFWKQYGNLVTWLLIAVLAGVAAWNGWNWWQREQAVGASGMYDELERSAAAGDVNAITRVATDLRTRYPRTTYAQQGALLAARWQFEKGQIEPAREALNWVIAQSGEPELRALAKLRLAGLLADEKKHDEALKQLESIDVKGFEGIAADRRGDVLAAMGKAEEAKAAYNQALKGLDSQLSYRRLVEAKLSALGAAPETTK